MTVAGEAGAPTAPEPKRRSGLLHRTSIGAAALTASSALRLGLQLAMLPILARLIGPTEYGLVAMAMPIILFANVLADGGMSYALGRKHGVSPELESTVLWLSGAIGGAIGLVCALAAWPLAFLLHEPRLTPLILALSPILLMNGLTAASNGKIIREGRFGVFAGGDLASTLAGAAVALAAATHGFGAWSLVGQQLTLWLVKLVWLTFNGRIPLKPAFRVREARDLIRFGVHAIGATLADYVSRNIDNMIVGGVLGSMALGFYAMAYQIVRVPDMLLTGPLYLYIFTAVSRAAHASEQPAVKELAAGAVRLASSGFAPLFCGLAIVGDLAVPLVLGEKWNGAILPLRCLTGAGFFFCICSVVNATLMGLGRSDLQLRLSMILGGATIVIVSATAPFGVSAVSIGLAVGIGLVCGVYMHQLAKHLKMRRRTLAVAFRPALLAAGAMSAALILARHMLDGRMAAGPEVVLLILLGAAIYAAVLLALARQRLLEDVRGFSRAHAEPAPATS